MHGRVTRRLRTTRDMTARAARGRDQVSGRENDGSRYGHEMDGLEGKRMMVVSLDSPALVASVMRGFGAFTCGQFRSALVYH